MVLANHELKLLKINKQPPRLKDTKYHKEKWEIAGKTMII